MRTDRMRCRCDRWRDALRVVGSDIPFEFVGEVASSGAMAEASHVEGGPTARHVAVAVGICGLISLSGIQREKITIVPEIEWRGRAQSVLVLYGTVVDGCERKIKRAKAAMMQAGTHSNRLAEEGSGSLRHQ
jgi:hypothetical protein